MVRVSLSATGMRRLCEGSYGNRLESCMFGIRLAIEAHRSFAVPIEDSR